MTPPTTRPLAGVAAAALVALLLAAPVGGLQGQERVPDAPGGETAPAAWPVVSLGIGPAVDLDGPDALIFLSGGLGVGVRLGRHVGLRGDLKLLLATSGSGVFIAEAPAAVLRFGEGDLSSPRLRGGPVLWFSGGNEIPSVSVPGFFVGFSAPLGRGGTRLDLSGALVREEGLLLEAGLDFELR